MTIQTETTQPAQTPEPQKRTRERSTKSRPGEKTTKRAQLVQLLRARTGADVTTISAKLGWQPHTTRAALTGLRKAGYAVEAEKGGDGKPSRYRITALPAAKATAPAAGIE